MINKMTEQFISEHIFNEDEGRFVIYPIKHHDVKTNIY